MALKWWLRGLAVLGMFGYSAVSLALNNAAWTARTFAPLTSIYSYNASWLNNQRTTSLIRRIKNSPGAEQLNPQTLALAIQAYQRSLKNGITPQKPLITIIDYSLPSSQKRLWVIDLNRGKVLYNSLVAHGKNSGRGRFAKHFSNRAQSLQTSLGVFLTEDTYFGRDGFSLRLEGLERGINDNAKKRFIVIHGAPYVSQKTVARTGKVGCSWGCPAVEPQLAKPIIDTIKDGSLVFAFYPDKTYLKNSRFL